MQLAAVVRQAGRQADLDLIPGDGGKPGYIDINYLYEPQG